MGMVSATQPLSFLPSPSVNGFHIGPLFVHFYGLMYVVGIALAIYITRRRWQRRRRQPRAGRRRGHLGRAGRHHRRPDLLRHHHPGRHHPARTGGACFAVWSGGLGIWGGVALGAAAGIWRVRRSGASAGLFANAGAPALLVAQAVGRIGNYFNQELFGKPSTLPWALEIAAGAPARRVHPVRDVPADLPVRADLGPGPGRLPGLARPSPPDPAVGPVRALRGRLLGVPDLRGVAADRLLRALPGPAAELLRGHCRHGRRAGLVLVNQRRPAPADERALAAGRWDPAAADATAGAARRDADAAGARRGRDARPGRDSPTRPGSGSAAGGDAATGAVSAPRTEK